MTVAPSCAASSGEHVGPRPVRVETVELSDCFRGVSHVLYPLPGWRIVTPPFHQVLEPVVVESAVKDPVHLPFFFAVDDDGRRRGRLLAGEGVVCRMFQEGHVEHRVYAHRVRQTEPHGIRAYNL